MKPTISGSRGIIKWGVALTILGLAALAAIYVLALVYTPLEVRQGAAQKIFYVHVPAAWMSMMIYVLRKYILCVFSPTTAKKFAS